MDHDQRSDSINPFEIRSHRTILSHANGDRFLLLASNPVDIIVMVKIVMVKILG